MWAGLLSSQHYKEDETMKQLIWLALLGMLMVSLFGVDGYRSFDGTRGISAPFACSACKCVATRLA